MPKFAPGRSGGRLLRCRVLARAVLAAGAALVAVASALLVGGTPAGARPAATSSQAGAGSLPDLRHRLRFQ